jgi:hypothetical protein
MSHSDYEALKARVDFEETAALWCQRLVGFAGIFVLILLLGELL